MQEQSDMDSWNVREDHMLLDAVEMFGYGNWKDIASHLETKNETQVWYVKYKNMRILFCYLRYLLSSTSNYINKCSIHITGSW